MMTVEEDLHNRFLTHVSKKLKFEDGINLRGKILKRYYIYMARISFVFNKTSVPTFTFMYCLNSETLDDILFFTFNREKARISSRRFIIDDITGYLLNEKTIQEMIIDGRTKSRLLNKKNKEERIKYFMIEGDFYSFIDDYFQLDLRPYDTFNQMKNICFNIDQWKKL